jgi:hypothetical protein
MRSPGMSDLLTASAETVVHETTGKMVRAMRIHLAKKERQEKKEPLVKNAVREKKERLAMIVAQEKKERLAKTVVQESLVNNEKKGHLATVTRETIATTVIVNHAKTETTANQEIIEIIANHVITVNRVITVSQEKIATIVSHVKTVSKMITASAETIATLIEIRIQIRTQISVVKINVLEKLMSMGTTSMF